MSPSSSHTYTHTHTYAHTHFALQRQRGLSENTEHSRPLWSATSDKILQWSKPITSHHSENRQRKTHWQSRRQIPKTYRSLCRFHFFFFLNESVEEQWHTILLLYIVLFFHHQWRMNDSCSLLRTWQQLSHSNQLQTLHTKYLLSGKYEGRATTVWK